MADPFIAQLDAIAHPPAATFLKKLGPIHYNWHAAHNSGTGQTGFLLFHWELIKRFEAAGGEASFGGVTPFTTADFVTYQRPYPVTTAVPAGDLTQFDAFSDDVEDWHNHAHMAIGMAFHIDLMNAKTNVKHVAFWRLHYFINDRFEEKLATFRPGPAAAAVAALEAGAGVAEV